MSNQQALEDWLILSPPRCGLSCFVLLVVKSSIFFFVFFFFLHHCTTFFPPLCFFLCRIVLDFCECGDLRRHQRWGEFPPALGNPLSVWTTPFPTVGSSVSRRRYYFNLPREFSPVQMLCGVCWHLNSPRYIPFSYMCLYASGWSHVSLNHSCSCSSQGPGTFVFTHI